jgi:hypothetical protein
MYFLIGGCFLWLCLSFLEVAFYGFLIGRCFLWLYSCFLQFPFWRLLSVAVQLLSSSVQLPFCGCVALSKIYQVHSSSVTCAPFSLYFYSCISLSLHTSTRFLWLCLSFLEVAFCGCTVAFFLIGGCFLWLCRLSLFLVAECIVRRRIMHFSQFRLASVAAYFLFGGCFLWQRISFLGVAFCGCMGDWYWYLGVDY